MKEELIKQLCKSHKIHGFWCGVIAGFLTYGILAIILILTYL